MIATYDSTLGYVRITVGAHWPTALDLREILGVLSRVPHGTSVLVDIRALNISTAPSGERLRQAISELARQGAVPARTALLVHHGAQFGLGRMLQVFGESIDAQVDVFTDELSAVEWVSRGERVRC